MLSTRRGNLALRKHELDAEVEVELQRLDVLARRMQLLEGLEDGVVNQRLWRSAARLFLGSALGQ